MPLSIGQLLYHDRYRIDGLLTQGGMGAIYRAQDLNLNITVAIKENLDASPDAQKQFVREANILARLSHPNLPRVLDYFFIPDQGQYLVMDFVEGEDLQSMLRRLKCLPESQVLPWVTQICDALAYLHSQPSPIIHRDIKPANIRIRPDGRAMLVDFGIAKVYDPHLATTVGARAVTPGYSPPEQYGGGLTDARSDIYALGATLYHLLTGAAPPDSVKRMIRQAELLPPRQVNASISPQVEQAILRSTELDSDRRFQRIEELRAALQGSAARLPEAQPARPATPPTVASPTPISARNVAAPPARPVVAAPSKPRQALPARPKASAQGKRPSTGSIILIAFVLTALALVVVALIGFVAFGGKLPVGGEQPPIQVGESPQQQAPISPITPPPLSAPGQTEPPPPLIWPPQPERPTPVRYQPVGEIFIPEYPQALRAVQVRNSFAYVLAANGELHVFDIAGMGGAEPFITNNKVVATRKMQNATGLLRIGDFLYVYGNTGFEILDIHDPANPTLVKDVGDVPIYNMMPQGPLLIATGDSGFSIYETEDIPNPHRFTFQETGKGVLAYAAVVQEHFMYISLLDQTKNADYLRVYDVSDPGLPKPLEEIPHAPVAYHLYVSDNQLIACADSQIEVWSLEDPVHPHPVFDAPGPSRACILDGHNLIADGLFNRLMPGRFETFDKFDPGEHTSSLPYVSAFSGNLVFYIADHGVTVFAGYESNP